MDNQWKELFSHEISAENRTYYFNIQETAQGKKQIVIGESHHDGEPIEHGYIMIFEEHLDAFWSGISRMRRFIKKKNQAYDERFERIRRKYPRAYEKWSKQEDETLFEEHRSGKSIKELAVIFQRQPSAIRSRLKKRQPSSSKLQKLLTGEIGIWTVALDNDLIDAYAAGDSIGVLAQKFQLSPQAIRARLEKLAVLHLDSDELDKGK